MDARTDSFLSLKQGKEKEQELPAFNPTHELLPQELIWILDEVLRLEVSRTVLSTLRALVADSPFRRRPSRMDIRSTAPCSPAAISDPKLWPPSR